MFYKNVSASAKTFYGVTFKPGEIKEVKGFINASKMILVDAPKPEPKQESKPEPKPEPKKVERKEEKPAEEAPEKIDASNSNKNSKEE